MPRLALILSLLLAACAPAQTRPPQVVSESPSDAFVRYWETRLEQTHDAATWRELCAALEAWPALQPRHVMRLDAAMAAWPDALRRPPERWRAIDQPIPLPAWPLVRAIELGEGDAAGLSSALPHLDTVTVLTVDGAVTVAALAESEALPSAREVRILRSDLDSLSRFVNTRGKDLVGLDVWENNLGPRLGEILTGRSWTKLERLDVGANKLDSTAAQQLARLDAPGLHTLGISFNPLTDEGFAAITAGSYNLRELDARATGLGIASVKALAQQDVGKLEALDLSDNALGDDAIVDLSTLPLRSLRALRLNNVGVSREGLLALSGVLGGGLAVLELGRNNLGDEGVALLCTPGSAGLRFLQLDSVKLTNASVRVIARCPHLQRLESLSLHANGDLDATGMTELAAASFPTLTALGLDNCSLGDDGLAALTQSSWWPRLTHLRIEANGFTDASANLLDGLPPDVENLGLGWNDFGRASAQALASTPLPRLRVLSLRGSALDDAALRMLIGAPWLATLDELDLRALPYDGIAPAIDSVAARLPDHATLRREQ